MPRSTTKGKPMLDLSLAIVHHLAVFALFGIEISSVEAQCRNRLRTTRWTASELCCGPNLACLRWCLFLRLQWLAATASSRSSDALM